MIRRFDDLADAVLATTHPDHTPAPDTDTDTDGGALAEVVHRYWPQLAGPVGHRHDPS